jgi:tRNA threonylcarbamoyl adenosine modification protein YeaZ
MSWVLGIDTAAGVTVVVWRDAVAVAERRLDDSRRHAEALTPLIAAALAEAGVGVAELDEIVVGMGPGPFTGLRVGIVTAETLAAVAGVPVRHVCSLDWVAAGQVPHDGEFVAAIDARRHEVYWARYAPDGTRLAGPFVSAPDQVPELPVVCEGASPRTSGRVATLPEVGPEPLYLRRPDATVSTTRKPVLTDRELR